MPNWNRMCEIWGPDAPEESGPDYYGEHSPEELAAANLAEIGNDPDAIRALLIEHAQEEPVSRMERHPAWLRMFDAYARAYCKALGCA